MNEYFFIDDSGKIRVMQDKAAPKKFFEVRACFSVEHLQDIQKGTERNILYFVEDPETIEYIKTAK